MSLSLSISPKATEQKRAVAGTHERPALGTHAGGFVDERGGFERRPVEAAQISREEPALDLASQYREFSDQLRELVCERIDDEYGLEVPQMMIVNISLPEAVEKAMDTRSSMGVIGDMGKFQQYQMGQAMLELMENE